VVLRFASHVRPGARNEHVGGTRPGRHGGALVVAVRARAVGGAADAAVVAALAGAFAVRCAAVTTVDGHRGRAEVVEVDGGGPAVLVRLREG
jgi:uncharacterized protein YggU (UPF0235/DUF167 family)